MTTSTTAPQGTDAYRGRGEGPLHPTRGTLRPLPFGAIELEPGFLGDLQRRNSEKSIGEGESHLREAQAWDNFDNAATGTTGEYHGPIFEDGEAYKWLEAVAWDRGRRPDDVLDEWLAGYTARIAAAQDDDGYLDTFNQIAGKRGRYEWMAYDHEIFNIGALTQAAVAQYRSTGRTELLEVARRAADHLIDTFGPGRREETCGHPLIEMALVELYRVTEDERYLDQAKFFVDVRGGGTLVDPTGHFPSSYFSDRVPVRDARTLEGHAVRAVYFAAGATDVAVETQDDELLDILRTQWDNVVESKMYVNGSLGSRWEGEAFGDPFELPTDRGYGETCAAIASMQWSWRLLLATGAAKYAELIERQLYNAVLSGVSLDGSKYFYVNSLQVRGDAVPDESRTPSSGRHEWFGTSCCPTNLMRTIASLHEYVASGDESGIQLHQFTAGSISGGDLTLSVDTAYPWEGRIGITVADAPQAARQVAIRIPSWAAGATASVNGKALDGVTAGEYLRLDRTWAAGDVIELDLPLMPRLSTPHPRNDAARGCVTVERGPLVYALEQADQPEGIRVDDVRLRRDAELVEVTVTSGPLDGVPGVRIPVEGGEATAIPYFLWANREVGPMRVWIPVGA